MLKYSKLKSIIKRILLIESMLIILSIPFVFSWTYAISPVVATQTITYTPNRLTWDDDTIQSNATLKIFDHLRNAISHGDYKLIAPGTSGDEVIRLVNHGNKKIEYKAIMYYYEENANIPLNIDMRVNDYLALNDDTTDIQGKLVKSIEGELATGEIENFQLHWNWQFDENETQNINDTDLGDLAVTNDLVAKIGFRIIVTSDEDISSDIHNQMNGSNHGLFYAPKTGVKSWMKLYTILIVCSILVLLWIWIERDRDEEENKA